MAAAPRTKKAATAPTPTAAPAPQADAPRLTELEAADVKLRQAEVRITALTRENAELKLKVEERDAAIFELRVKETMERNKASIATHKQMVEKLKADERVAAERVAATIKDLSERLGFGGAGFHFNPATREAFLSPPPKPGTP